MSHDVSTLGRTAVPRTDAASAARPPRRLSTLAEGLVGSEILRIAAEIRTMREAGAAVSNLTVGDFDPAQFPIPEALAERIAAAIAHGETNYPPSNGLPQLRQAVSALYERALGLRYAPDTILVTGGSRPGIYAAYRTLVDPGDRVVYPVPSWNNNHYCHLAGAEGVAVPCPPEDDFLPTRARLAPALRGARLVALCSPLNPAGTAFSADALGGICDLVLEENARRERSGERPLYVLYDQVYWALTFGGTVHHTPVGLRPEMLPYTVFVDGVSKAFAGTGLRVGWVAGPADVVRRMVDVVGHVGAWAPRAEQVATAGFLGDARAVDAYLDRFRRGVRERLDALHGGIAALRDAGLPVDAVAPAGAIYLSARFALLGRRAPEGGAGAALHTNEDVRRYLLRRAGVAVVPFQAFGATEESGWFRLSVGAVSVDDITRMLPRLRDALEAVAAT
ncbi:MAG: pyridoxal phosphate-dependent aminotransferase [Gemmatimonadaceae bacterium]